MTGEGTAKRLTTNDIAMMKQYDAQGLSRKEICEKMHLSKDTVYRYIGPAKKWNKVQAEDILRMQELRTKGLSNAQIGIELGFAASTIAYYIGPQPSGNRSNYGSIVAHADGEHYVQEDTIKKEALVEKPVTHPAGILAIERSVTTYRGESMSYKIDTAGTIAIKDNCEGGPTVQMSFDQFNRFLEELMALIDKIPHN